MRARTPRRLGYGWSPGPRVELLGLGQLGLVRGVFFGFMVLSTAVSPFLLGAALSAAVPLEVIGGVLALYALAAPWIAARVLERHAGRMRESA